MPEKKDDFKSNALSDVEKFLLLLSDLKIMDSENQLPLKPSQPKDQEDEFHLNAQFEDLSEDLQSVRVDVLVNVKQNDAINPIIDSSDIKRSPSVYPFPSLLDELPFLRDIQPYKQRELEENPSNDDAAFLPFVEIDDRRDRSDAINLIQTLLLGDEIPQISQSASQSISQLNQKTIEDIEVIASISSENSSDDDKALHLLQDILVVPELEDLRSFKISVEQKLGIVESQVNSPEMMNKIKDLEKIVQDASLDLNNLGSKLQDIGNDQINIPTEIAAVSRRIAQLEHRIYDPNELVQLLLPIIADLLNLKVSESREAMCQAIMPIIAEVIFERSQLDREAMSHAIANILPTAIEEQIRNSPDAIALAIAPEIGAAIREQIRLDRDAIIDALAPEMGAAIKQQIVLERDSMVDALYPVIGSTISKYFAEAIRSINEKVEDTFSFDGLSRKVRAKMRGISEAELILKESARFEVQAIFLIHNLSGLVMIDIQQSDLDALAEPIDADMLAGMLTAIRSFANDCISRSANATELDAINYSGSKILLEVAGYCYLAIIIQGEPDRAFVTKIRNVFGQIVQVYGDRLKQFDGDPSVIPTEVENALKTLIGAEMEASRAKVSSKSSKALILVGFALLALIFIPIGIYQYQSSRDRQLEAKVLEAFASTPELAVYRLNVSARGDHLKLSGKLPNQSLRDRALQVTTETIKSEFKSRVGKIDNSIYAVNVPPDVELVAIEVQRLTKALNYTQGVKITTQFENGQVTITGQIEQPKSIPKITQTFIKISGVTAVNNATIIVMPKLSKRIYFPFGVTTLQPIDLEGLAEIQTFLEQYPDYNIKIYAKGDSIGSQSLNYQLGLKRSEVVRAALLQRGISNNRLQISERVDTSIHPSSDQLSRWVEFEPILK